MVLCNDREMWQSVLSKLFHFATLLTATLMQAVAAVLSSEFNNSTILFSIKLNAYHTSFQFSPSSNYSIRTRDTLNTLNAHNHSDINCTAPKHCMFRHLWRHFLQTFHLSQTCLQGVHRHTTGSAITKDVMCSVAFNEA